MWGADWKFRHEGNCSASRGLLSDAEQLPEWRNFRFAPKNHYGFFFLHTFTSTIASRHEYVLFYQFYTKITTFFYQERFCTAPLLDVDVETFGRNWHENDVKIVILTSCTRVVLHPSCKTTFPSHGRVRGNPGRVCKKNKFWKMDHLISFHCQVNLRFRFTVPNISISFTYWTATWQNQQNECVPSEDSDQPGHPPSLIRVFAVRMKKAWVLSYPLSAQRRLWSDWANAQADLSLCWPPPLILLVLSDSLIV